MGTVVMESAAIERNGVHFTVSSLQREDAGDGVVGCVGLYDSG